jgi:hypothetical protein
MPDSDWRGVVRITNSSFHARESFNNWNRVATLIAMMAKIVGNESLRTLIPTEG